MNVLPWENCLAVPFCWNSGKLTWFSLPLYKNKTNKMTVLLSFFSGCKNLPCWVFCCVFYGCDGAFCPLPISWCLHGFYSSPGWINPYRWPRVGCSWVGDAEIYPFEPQDTYKSRKIKKVHINRLLERIVWLERNASWKKTLENPIEWNKICIRGYFFLNSVISVSAYPTVRFHQLLRE